MSEITKDFLKFVIEVFLILIVLLVLFSEQGIASNTFNFLTYVEPILLQNWLSSALTTGSYSPGYFITNTKTTGQPYTIKIFNENKITYVLVEPPQEVYLKTKFATIEKTPLITNCKVPEQTIKLKKNLIQTIVVQKILTNDGCLMNISIPTETVIISPYLGPGVS